MPDFFQDFPENSSWRRMHLRSHFWSAGSLNPNFSIDKYKSIQFSHKTKIIQLGDHFTFNLAVFPFLPAEFWLFAAAALFDPPFCGLSSSELESSESLLPSESLLESPESSLELLSLKLRTPWLTGSRFMPSLRSFSSEKQALIAPQKAHYYIRS